MSAAPTFKYFQTGNREIPFLPIIKDPTPVVAGTFRGHKFMVKREDMTDVTIYGGNKVRNLEFILADAILRDRRSVATPIPVGSNFSAAFVGHALNHGLTPNLCQVVLASHPQIEDHRRFCEAANAPGRARAGRLKFLAQTLDVAAASVIDRALIVAPGGSTVLGALGHLKAFAELETDIKSGLTPCPDKIFVGAGTGGTSAGLLAGITLSGLPIQLVAVRCAEPIICNKGRFIRLANRLLRFLGHSKRVDPDNLTLVDSPDTRGYGQPLDDFAEIFRDFYLENGIELDRTYTSKVVHSMARYLDQPPNRDVRVLYWHTFSAMASRELSRSRLFN